MNDRGTNNPIIKYLSTDDFINYCKANRVDISDDTLETYEKYGLLMPLYRLIFPEEYIKERYECEKNSSYQEEIIKLIKEHNSKVEKAKHEKDELSALEESSNSKWKQVESLINARSKSNIMIGKNLEDVIKDGHPLDIEFQKQNPCLKVPDKKGFRPWKDYEIVIEGSEENFAEHYYASWQIFLVEELNELYIYTKNCLSNEKRGSTYVFTGNIRNSKLLKYSDCFQAVSNFRMLQQVIWGVTEEKANEHISEDERDKNYSERIKEFAKIEYSKQSKENWINFIRKLVELYDHYEKLDKNKLLQELKIFLSDTVNMIIIARGIEFKTLCVEYASPNIYGTGTVFYTKGLERIFPIEEKQVKEKALRIVHSYIKEINEGLTQKLPEDFHKQIVSEIIGPENILLLTHLHEIEDLWFNRTSYWEGTFWAHLRSFVIGIEDIAKQLFPPLPEEEKRKKDWYLSDAIKKAFPEYKKWKNEYNSKVNTPEEFISKIKDIFSRKDFFTDSNPLCRYHLLITHLTRNFVSHNIKMPSAMAGSLFIETYKCLILTLVSFCTRYYLENPNN
ncbi:MAG: hypothetical protein PHX21_05740 [bacterium]|nr:hypothetical protein [bacterium]